MGVGTGVRVRVGAGLGDGVGVVGMTAIDWAKSHRGRRSGTSASVRALPLVPPASACLKGTMQRYATYATLCN